jgi:hypothetical protein
MRCWTAVEWHPENGFAAYVVVTRTEQGNEFWHAFTTKQRAEYELPRIETAWKETLRDDGDTEH